MVSFTNLLTFLPILSTLFQLSNGFTITEPAANSTVDLRKNVTIAWTYTAADPPAVHFWFSSSNFWFGISGNVSTNSSSWIWDASQTNNLLRNNELTLYLGDGFNIIAFEAPAEGVVAYGPSFNVTGYSGTTSSLSWEPGNAANGRFGDVRSALILSTVIIGVIAMMV